MIYTEYQSMDTAGRMDSNITIAIVADPHETNPDPVLKILRDHKPDVIAVPGDLFETIEPSEKPENNEDSFFGNNAL